MLEDSPLVVDDESERVLMAIALKVLLKVLFAFRTGQCGLLRATTALSKQVAE